MHLLIPCRLRPKHKSKFTISNCRSSNDDTILMRRRRTKTPMAILEPPPSQPWKYGARIRSHAIRCVIFLLVVRGLIEVGVFDSPCWLEEEELVALRSVGEASTLKINNIFFLIEGQDGALQSYAADAICSTWLQKVPPQNARFYSDTHFSLPESCHRVGQHNHTFPCYPGNSSLGNSLVAAQYKREHIHFQFTRDLAANRASFPPGIRWIVSTEQDTWYDTKVLLRYLRYIERNMKDIHERPAISFKLVGPFLVFNMRMLQGVLGNTTFMDSCRHTLLKPRRYPLQGKYDGAAYNNDHLVQWAVKRCKKCKRFRLPGCDKRRGHYYEQSAFVYDREKAFPSSSNLELQNLISYHHVKSRESMVALEECAASRHAKTHNSSSALQDRCSIL
jgi:hypothetical protein